ncbi:MAG: HEPN family nuclease [Planctomycetota bacterium]|jgi:hypothetical protein
MVYAPEDFVDSYMRRTLKLIHGYKGPHQATNLINSLLGLLVVPGDAFVARGAWASRTTATGARPRCAPCTSACAGPWRTSA